MNKKEIISYQNDGYYIQNRKVVSLCKEFGTPLYVYDLNTVLQQYTSLYDYIKWPKSRIYYAMKANYNLDILQALKENGAYLDTVSPAEVLLALRIGFKKDHILFTANNMTDEEMHLIKKYDVLFNIDSISRLAKYAKAFPGSKVCLRFNSEVVAGENEKVQTAGESVKFGISLEEVSQIQEIVTEYKLKVVGLHEHTGSGIAETEKIYQGMKNLLRIATRDNFPDLLFIDFGGGFKVRYHPEDPEIDYRKFGNRITQIFEEYCRQYGRELYMYFEPGKYIVAESGMLIIQVNTIKNNKSNLIIGTNSGFPQLIRPVFYGAYHHILNLSNPHGVTKKYDIYGNTCESGDCFAKGRMIPEIREGDYLGILNAGAYCFSMASIYNLRSLPAEVVILNNQVKLSRERMNPEVLVDHLLNDYNVLI